MQVKPYVLGEDYPEICEWWRAHSQPHVPCHALPATGAIAHQDGVKYCAGFLYRCEANWGWLEWVVTNPKSPILKRKAALDLLVGHLVTTAKSLGIENMIATLGNENLMRLYEKHGFKRGSFGVTEMHWRVS